MRLLKLGTCGEISLTTDLIENVPPYAILSHTWGADDEEVTFDDVKNGSGKSKAGYDKIRFCGEQASIDDLKYFWVDTCCIDKANLTELSEAITSMFRWYRDAVKCYVYLSDVSACTNDDNHTERRWKPEFRKSKWFTRGWTLQELIAPESVEFFSQEGERLGSKGTLAPTIHEITNIPIDVLCGAPLSGFSVDERLQWAEKRETKRREDKAYCLLGVFNVSMSLRYGEGDNAFIRFKSKIDKLSGSKFDEATMKSLSDFKVTNPEEDMKRIELSKDRLLEDCYKWILQDPNFQAWHSTDATPLLWINGDPGKGKTMLVIALVRELSNDNALTFFFCQSTDLRLNNAASILRGLIWKLVIDHPHLAIHIHDKYKSNNQPLNGPNTIILLFSILSAMLDDCPRAFLIIDALDECNPGTERDQLLDLIIEHAKSLKAKWLLTSRNYPDIKQRLETESRMLNLELNEKCISDAVAAFIKIKTDDLAKIKKYSPGLKENVKKELTCKANSTFLWVALACKSLLDFKVTRRKTLSTLEKLPSGLKELYTRMMEQVLQGEDEDDRNYCLQILRSSSLAFRPLSTEELITMAKLPLELTDDDGLSELIELCSSFIIVRKRILYFVHQSAKDYLVSDGAQKLFTADFQQDHGLLACRSLDVMSNTLKRDICNLRYPGSSPSTANIHIHLKAINYACSFWVEHLAKYLSHPTHGLRHKEYYFTDQGRVHKFLLKHLLHWFEALSLIGELSRGITGLHNLEQMIGDIIKIYPNMNCVGHKRFLYDAIRVFRQFRPAVEVAPLQVYCSILIFSPENSLVRRNFEHEKPRWISPPPQIQAEWSPCLQTLEGHSTYISSVILSPGGQQLASASGDCTVRLWDAATGACQYTLEDHSSNVASVTFSPGGQQLASASDDGTVRLWDAATGACQYTLEGHSDHVSSVTFSPSGQQLASASRDGTVQLWDVATGACQHTLESHLDSVYSVSFSPNGQQLASASRDGTVRLWDTTTGACQHTLEGHLESVSSAIFSPGGQQLASASDDGTVRLWDAATGACQHTLEGHLSNVISVMFSPGGQQLASASHDSTVRLWDAVTGACQYTLKGHSSSVRLVTFSPVGQQLASASQDGTIRLWDAATGVCQHALEGHSGPVSQVMFLPGGQQLASASWDGTVRLWDAAAGAGQHTLEGHSSSVRLVTFSPGGQQLASASHDGTVWLWDAATGVCQHALELASAFSGGTVLLWDTATGACQHTLGGHLDYVSSVTFSPGGQQLALVSSDDTVRLWDAATGACQHTLEGHLDSFYSVTFSPDGQQLASASHNGTMRLWDTATGACQHTLEGHLDSVYSVTFSPDGQQLASASGDGIVRLWDAATGACQHTFEGGTSTIAFSPDGSSLVTDFGVLSARRSKSDKIPEQVGFSLRSEKWVTWNGDEVLWLPPEYRPVRSAAAENRIAIGCNSGLVYILNFCPENFPP